MIFRSHCDCDQDFLKCLKAANNSVAMMLGNIYFNVLKVQCIKEEKPLVCIEVRLVESRVCFTFHIKWSIQANQTFNKKQNKKESLFTLMYTNI